MLLGLRAREEGRVHGGIADMGGRAQARPAPLVAYACQRRQLAPRHQVEDELRIGRVHAQGQHLAPVTHPWPGGVGWYNPLLATRAVAPLFARTVALPLGKLLIGPGVMVVFAPQEPPENYTARAAVELILRPSELIANAEDLTQLKAFVAANPG